MQKKRNIYLSVFCNKSLFYISELYIYLYFVVNRYSISMKSKYNYIPNQCLQKIFVVLKATFIFEIPLLNCAFLRNLAPKASLL